MLLLCPQNTHRVVPTQLFSCLQAPREEGTCCEPPGATAKAMTKPGPGEGESGTGLHSLEGTRSHTPGAHKMLCGVRCPASVLHLPTTRKPRAGRVTNHISLLGIKKKKKKKGTWEQVAWRRKFSASIQFSTAEAATRRLTAGLPPAPLNPFYTNFNPLCKRKS